MFALELVPRMFYSLGLSIDEAQWLSTMKDVSRSKKCIEIQQPELPETISAGDLDGSFATQSPASSAKNPSPSPCPSSVTSFDVLSGENEELKRENQCLKRKLFQANMLLAARKSKIHRARVRTAKMQAKKIAEDAKRDGLMEIRKTKSSRNLTAAGVVATGLRMALSSCSALSFPRAAWVDISRTTVSRCEVKLAATVFIRSKVLSNLVFHRFAYSIPQIEQVGVSQENVNLAAAMASLPDFKCCKPFLQDLRVRCQQKCFDTSAELGREEIKGLLTGLHELVSLPPPANESLFISALSVQNDATNSEIWHKNKLTSMAVEISTLVDVELLSKGDYEKAFFTDHYMFLYLLGNCFF